jgi:hypothetical protein
VERAGPGEEGIEHLFPYLGQDAGTVVANTDFDCLAKVSGGSGKERLKAWISARILISGARL